MRFRYMRRLPAVLVAALATLPSMLLPTPAPAQSSPGAPGAFRVVELGVDPDRLAPGSPVALGEALAVRAEFDEPVAVVLHGWRIIRGGIVAEHASTPFPVPEGASVRPADVDALPASSFYGTSSAGPDDVVTGIRATGALAVDDPAALVTRNAGRLPHGWQDREVLVFVAVPSDETAAATTGITAVIALGAATEAATGGGATGGSAGGASDVASLLQRHVEATQMCSGWVKDVTLYRETQGWIVPEYYEAYQGGPACRQIPYQQVVDRWYRESGEEPTRFTHEYADGLDMLGGALDRGLIGEGFGPIGGGGRALTGTMSDFVRAGAEVDSDTLLVDDVERRMSDMAEFIARARRVGTEVIDGRSVIHVRAEDLTDVELYQPTGPQYVLQSVDLWIDQETMGMVGMKSQLMEDGTGRAMTVELRNDDFVTLPNGAVVAGRTSMRVSGGGQEMSEKDREKMEKAVEQVEQMEKQMEKLPPAARQMMEQQIVRLKAMSEPGGGVMGEAVVRLVHAAVNEGPPVPGGVADLELLGNHFERARVVVEWQEAGYTAFPRSLDFRGEANGLIGSMTLDAIDLDEVEEEHLHPTHVIYADVAYVAPTRAAGRLEGGENPLTFGPEPAVVEIYHMSLSEVFGTVTTDGNGSAVFRAGHMPCSTQPRAIGLQLAPEGVNLMGYQTPGNLERSKEDADKVRDSESCRALLERNLSRGP